MFEGISSPPPMALWYGLALAGAVGLAGIIAMGSAWVRNRVFPPPRRVRLSDHIHFETILEDGRTIVCEDGTLFQLVEFGGTDLNALSAERQRDLWLARVAWLNGLADRRIKARVFSLKQRRRLEPRLDGFSGLLRSVMEAWSRQFDSAFRMRHLILVSIAPNVAAAQEQLRDSVADLVSSLREFGPEVLTLEPARPKGRGGRLNASPLLSAMADLLNPGFGHAVAPGRPPRGDLGALPEALCASQADMIVDGADNGLFVFRQGNEERWVAGIGIALWGEQASDAMIGYLMAVDCEIHLVHWLHPLDGTIAKAVVEDRRNREVGIRFGRGLTQRVEAQFAVADELLEARGGSSGQALLEYQLAAFVIGRSIDEVLRSVERCREAMQFFLYKTVRLTSEAMPIWFAQFPPHGESARDLRRPAKLFSGPAAQLISLETGAEGYGSCDWGDGPVASFFSAGGTPYSFIWHLDDSPSSKPPGHTVVFGATGGGKTTLVNFLALSSLRYPDAVVVLFDRSQGSYVAVRAAGGDYVAFAQSTRALELGMSVAQLAPFADMSQADFQAGKSGTYGRWVLRWLMDYVLALDPEQDQESERAIENALIHLAGMDVAKRTFDELAAAIPPNVSAKRALAVWTRSGPNGAYFQGGRDSLSFNNRLIAFDMTDILGEPTLMRALVPYIQRRLQMAVGQRTRPADLPEHVVFETTRPWLLLFDETAALLAERQMLAWYKVLLQEARKARGVVVSCFQRVETLREFGITQLVLEQCPTVIVLPNPNATEAYEMDLGLTAIELRTIRRDGPLAERLGRYFALFRRQNEGSIMVSTSMMPLGRYLSVFSSGPQAAADWQAAEQSVGSKDPLAIYEAYADRQAGRARLQRELEEEE